MSALRWLRRSGTHQLAMVLVCAGRGQVRDKKKGEDKKERTERKVEQWKKNKRERELGALAGQEGKLSSVWSGRAPREMKCDRRSRTEPHR